MKLVSFGPAGKERPGVVMDEKQILDLYRVSKGQITTVRQVIEMGEDGLNRIRNWLGDTNSAKHVVDTDTVRKGPPVTNPTKIIGVGLNYHSHTGEQKVKVPSVPLLFSKASTSLSGDGDPIWYPVEDRNVDYEVELGVIVGKNSFRIDPDKWEDHVFGYTIVNDVSGRDAQFSDRKWFRGKSYDSFCPMGPHIVTKDEIPDPHNLNLSAKLNGEYRQNSSTSKLIFNLPYLLSFITRNISLRPGDVIATGTPGGVGIFMKPTACMAIGDEIEVFVDGIGSITNFVKSRGEVLEPSVYPSP